LYVDHIERAKRHALADDCYRVFHLNYNEVREVKMQFEDATTMIKAKKSWPCNIEEIGPKFPILTQEVGETLSSMLQLEKMKCKKSSLYQVMAAIMGQKMLNYLDNTDSLKNILTLNGKYQIVEMNKSWWLKHQKNIKEDSPFGQYLRDTKKSQMTAQMIY